MLLATTGNGWVIPLQIKEDGISEGGIAAGPLPLTAAAEAPINFACWYSGGSTTPPPPIANTGGTGEHHHGSAGCANMCPFASNCAGLLHAGAYVSAANLGRLPGRHPSRQPTDTAKMCRMYIHRMAATASKPRAAQGSLLMFMACRQSNCPACCCCADITPGPDGQYYRWCAKVSLVCTPVAVQQRRPFMASAQHHLPSLSLICVATLLPVDSLQLSEPAAGRTGMFDTLIRASDP